MSSVPGGAVGRTWWLFFLVVLSETMSKVDLWPVAVINITHLSPETNHTSTEAVEGRYGMTSPKERAAGSVRAPSSEDTLACDPNVDFRGVETPWIALIERGNCTFAQKIDNAAMKGATAVVIYNKDGTGNTTAHFSHNGTGKTVAVMIGNIKGREILALVKNGIQVYMVIEVGRQHGPWMNQYSIFFVSISFFVVTAATVGYFIFYTARRLQIARAQLRKQNQLKNEAKKAINQLDLRTLKQGDQETGPDADTCAVCIEAYKPNDVVRILTCNHIFHKSCIDPWLLEHRTCPMCKCDILKALGIEIDEEKPDEAPELEQVSSSPQRSGQDRNTEVPEHAIYTLPSGQDECPATDDSPSISEEQRLFNNEARGNALSVYVLPQDNPAYEEIDLRDEVKS
ncbi:E3 ubiquitin-protein ligase RNF128 isoform X2 [Leucoraja erinacea]|uniref:E3 ubiquitin-protein ligase RNF128 isoform X2 n=1 Tax=Leucoraja erinaceus TaxID=7782 RepID=UPI0024582E9D|nr:E3 ubiquitin-protein ligase RNF128 isoform X2 [Leucoraja erinacea]